MVTCRASSRWARGTNPSAKKPPATMRGPASVGSVTVGSELPETVDRPICGGGARAYARCGRPGTRSGTGSRDYRFFLPFSAPFWLFSWCFRAASGSARCWPGAFFFASCPGGKEPLATSPRAPSGSC